MNQKNRDIIHKETVTACFLSLGVSIAAFVFQNTGTVPEFANRQWVERQAGAGITFSKDGDQHIYNVDYIDSNSKNVGFSVSCKNDSGVFVDVFRKVSSNDKDIYGYRYIAREEARKIVDAHGFCAGALRAVGRE